MKNNEIPLLPNIIYHIYNHANGKENLFMNESNYLFFLKRYQYFIEPIADTFAYCLMPNHLHLMVRIKDERRLQTANKLFLMEKGIVPEKITEIDELDLPKFVSRIFGNLFSSYSQAFNRQQNRKGSLFMPNFKRKTVDNEVYYTKLIHYIHNNPVHHQFVKNLNEWKFSSYQAFLVDKKTNILREEVLDWFGGKSAFYEFYQNSQLDTSFDI
jgi:REP element-mobilizing transposase RayT